MKHNKSEIYLDLSKCSEEEQKRLTILIDYDISKIDLWKYLIYNKVGFYDQVLESELEDRYEISFPQFCELFQDEKAGVETSKEVLQVENKIWVAYYNPCIHESSQSPLSFHKTEKGAQIALEFHKNEELKKWDEYFLELDDEAKQWCGVFGEHESWFIEQETLEI